MATSSSIFQLQHHTPNNHNQSPASQRPADPAGREDDDPSSDGDDSNPEDYGEGSRKRRRSTGRPMSVSCELCKQRKVKCDRGHPSCGWCNRNGHICEYKERKKPGLRAGYGRELESRLDKLESALQTQQQLLQKLANNLPQTNQQVQSQSQESLYTLPPIAQIHQESQTYGQRHPQYGVAYSGHSGHSNAPSPSYRSHHGNNTSIPPPQHHQHNQPLPPQQTTFDRIPPVTSPHDGYEASNPPLESPTLNISGTTGGSHEATVTTAHDADLPPYDLLYALVDLYFQHINAWCPILHRRSTLDSLFGSRTLDEADRIILHAIVATTLRFSTDVRLEEPSTKAMYHSRSKQKVLLYGLDNSSVKSLQALVILSLDIVGSSNGPPGWNLLALITRSVVQLGLAVETTSTSVNPLYPSIYTLRAMVLPEPKDFIEDESRRRLFWMIYLLDRYATISTAFEFALDDKEIDRKLPCRDDLFARNQPVETRWFSPSDRSEFSSNRPENLGEFSYYIEILGIMSKVHCFLKKPVDISALSDVEQWQREYRELDGVVNNWKFGLPPEYGNTGRLCYSSSSGNNKGNINCLWIMLHITYYTYVPIMSLQQSASALISAH